MSVQLGFIVYIIPVTFDCGNSLLNSSLFDQVNTTFFVMFAQATCNVID